MQPQIDERFFRTHITFTSVAKIVEISRPLKHIGFSYFTFDRHYNDGSRICLTNAGSWIEHYWRSGLYKAAIFEKDPMNFLDGYVFWDWLKRDPIYSAASEHDIDHGLTISEKHEQFSDFFHFGANRKRNLSHDEILKVMGYLYRFVASFKQKMRHIINAAVLDRQAFPCYGQTAQPIHSSDLNIDVSSGNIGEFLKSTEITRLYLGEEFNNAYLTRKEVCVLASIMNGDNFQTASSTLGLSESTFDYHISNIKKKLNCKSIFQLGCQIGVISEKNIYPFKVH